jgi:hypothetical protein
MTETDTGPGVVIGLDLFAGLTDQLARLSGAMERRERRREALYQKMHQAPLLVSDIPITNSAGVLQQADRLSPKAGYTWCVRRLAVYGFTAGTVNVYLNGSVIGGVVQGGEILVPFPQAGIATLGRGEVLLHQNDQITFGASGITLQSGYSGVRLGGAVDEFESWLLPEYLGL